MSRSFATRAGALGAGSVVLLLSLAALALRPFRLGRLLRTVSIPRLREHAMRTSLTMLGVALGVGVLVSVVILSRSIVSGVAATVDDLAGKADLQLSAGASGFDEDLLERVREVPGVARLTPVLQQIATIHKRERRDRVLVLGVDLLGKEDEHFRSYSSAELPEIRRDSLAFLNSTTNILLGRSLAQRLGVKLHDQVQVTAGATDQAFEVWGFIDDAGVGRAFGGAVGVMYYPAMQVAFGRGHNLDRIDIAIAPNTSPDRVMHALESAVGKGFVIERPAIRGERISKMLNAVRTAMLMASVVSLMTALFLIYNTMAISVVQRRREIGILRALGTKRGEILRLFTLEGLLIGSVAAAIGVAIGIGMAQGMLQATSAALDELYMQQAVGELQIDRPLLVFAFLIGTLGTAVASALPAYSAARVEPAQTLRTAAVMQWKPRATRITRGELLGLVLIALSGVLLGVPVVAGVPIGAVVASNLLLLGGALLIPRLVRVIEWLSQRGGRRLLGLEAQLASANLPRDIGRTAATASALMAGVALTVGFGTFIGSFVTSMNEWSEQLLPGDLFITSGAKVSGLSGRDIPLAPEFGHELAALPGVERVRTIRIAEHDFRGMPVKIAATEFRMLADRAHATVLEGGSYADLIAAWERGAAVVSENFSHRFGVHAGDRIELGTSRGLRTFEVAGVEINYTSDIGTISVDRKTYIEAFGDDRVDTFEVAVKKGSSIESVRHAIEQRYGESHDLFVLTNREFRGEFERAAQRIFNIMRSLQIVTLIVATLGVTNTLLANVLDRIREIGVLRALGMLRRQVQRLVLIEATLVGALGTLAGLLVGLGLGYIVIEHVTSVQTGWYLPYRVPWRSIAEVCLVTLPISALSGFYPARRAAALVVSDALEYE